MNRDGQEYPLAKPLGPIRSIWIACEPEETWEFLAEARNLERWWYRPESQLVDDTPQGCHFDADPQAMSVDLRWGGAGAWRHMRASVQVREGGSHVAATILPVPGCDYGCLEKESIRTGRDLLRLKRAIESRDHLLGSDTYWL